MNINLRIKNHVYILVTDVYSKNLYLLLKV